MLGNGEVFVGWGGSEPYFTEFNPGGTITLDAHFKPTGDDTYRAYRFQWNGQPNPSEFPPDVAATRSGGKTEVYASWNGATQVKKWIVKAGPTNPPTPVGTFDRTGFETHMTLNGTYKYVQVQAIDGATAPLGSSKVVQPSG